ncbi:TetR family transcriptional regulator [Nocardioides psychrotolerans]|uniref:Transcriptional regulator, TetR family n=1 Tax=Nocardioides psychrotolerans TaxID=1005945 RepID=A0A1I3BVK2_9ACTN|nr:TetR/AcrR family transcriptional regulator [Nocardioides psychrotolerans]GEP36429.1 TetR family transcriptional regulator [Nocardioides psychrotolerans]SFH66272.1 transcriptional regulator, TetR family [Nocardioides psychrotolerans]
MSPPRAEATVTDNDRTARPVTPPAATKRRVPTQARSRRKVEHLLDAAADLVVARGVEALTTRDIAEAAGVPVASLYQYFAAKEDVLLAIAERDMAEMDAQVVADLAEVPSLTLDALVRTTMGAFVTVYHRRRAFVEIYLRGRTNPAVHQFGRDHNARVAQVLRDVAIEQGLALPSLSPTVAMLAVEIGDRVFQLAFEHDDDGDPELIEEGVTMVSAYLARHTVSPVSPARAREPGEGA